MVRCPEGYTKECFYQKPANDHIPEAIGRVDIPGDDETAYYMVADSVEALVGLLPMGVPELHTWGAKRSRLERPDRIILDLDPDPAVEWSSVIEGAQRLRTLLEELDPASFVKTTGGKGLHIAVLLVWDELSVDIKSDHYTLANLPGRLRTLRHDPWKDYFSMKQNITNAMRRRLA